MADLRTEPRPANETATCPPWRDRRYRRELLTVVLLAGVLPAALITAVHFAVYDSVWLLSELHEMVELLGGFTAVVVTGLLLSRRQPQTAAMNVWCGCGLLMTGTLDVLHALSVPGGGFVWLRSLSNLAGGAMMALVWLPGLRVQVPRARLAPALAMVVAALLGCAVILARPWLPASTANGFTLPVMMVNGLGGLLFLAAAAGLVLRGRTDAGNALTLCGCCLLFGVASLGYTGARMWNPDWWMVHVFRAVAYLVLGLYFVREYRRTEEELAASLERLQGERRRFQDILDGLPAYVALLTPDHRLAFSNRLFRERFGESQGRRCYEFLFQRTTPCEVCETYEVLRTKAPRDWKWTGPDGRRYEISDLPFTEADGTALVLEAGIDVTERERAEREQQRLNRSLRTLSHCTEAVARASEEDTLLRGVCEIVVQEGGYPLAWVGYAEDDEQKTVRPVAVAGAGADYVRHARITWADTERGRGPTGTAIRSGLPCYIPEIMLDPRFLPWREAAARHGYASAIAIPLKEGEQSFGALNIYAPEANAFEGEEYDLMLELTATLTHGVLALRAHRERDRTAAELRELNETLERRVAQRTVELAASVEELESFTYSVSHDLRAPLRHIDGFSKVLLEQCGEQLGDLGRHYLERVRHGTQQMGQLVDDLLNLSRLGRCALQVRRTALGPLMQEVVEELQAEAAGRRVEWHIGGLPAVTCDRGLMRQVLFNLLSNALKFTRGRYPAIIEVGMKDGELFVRDNGVGFDPQYAGKLFGAFQRLHRSEEFPGTGVGLATVRRILRKHGGDIRAEAAVDGGATFYFTVSPPEAVSGSAVLEGSHAA